MLKAICVECGDEYSIKRKELGYRTCLECGDANARREVERRKKCSAPAYNKGAYQYVGSVSVAKGVGR